MKKRKLKGFVLPTLYMLITISIFTSIIFLGSSVNLKNKNYDYGINALKPVCPKCHAMLHNRKPAYRIEELRELAGL